MKFSKLALSGAALCMMNAAVVQAKQANQCISVEQAEAMVMYLLPQAVDASQKQCANNLPATATLLQTDSEQLEAYKAAAETAWPSAKHAFVALVESEFLANAGDELLRPLANVMMSQLINKEIKAKDCKLIDKIYSDLAPLLSANIAGLAITIFQASSEDDTKPDIPICKDPA
jgi:hypothetical protein